MIWNSSDLTKKEIDKKSKLAGILKYMIVNPEYTFGKPEKKIQE